MNNKNTYLKYDWRLDGADAEFCVDESLYPSAPDVSRPLLAYLYCAAPNDKPLSDADMRRILKLAAKCEKRLGLSFTGYIHTNAMRQYYIYLPDELYYDRLYETVSGQKRLSVRLGCSDEPSWTTYFKLLYPDKAKLQTVRNGETIAMLYQNGDSTAPRRLNLHMYFRSEPIRMKFEEEARLEGFAIGNTEERFYGDENADPARRAGREAVQEDCTQSEYARDEAAPNDPVEGGYAQDGVERLVYGVVLHRICAMKKRDIDAITVHAVRIAERFGGELLYWDCPIVPRIGR